MHATTKEDPRTGQFAPAIVDDKGKLTTYSPTSFDQARAQVIAESILATLTA